MTEGDLFEELEQDSKVDNTNLDLELARIPYLQSKWMKRYIQLSRDVRREEAAYARVKLARSNYWMGLASDEVYKDEPLTRRVLKAELPDILAADPKVQEASDRLETFREVALVVEKFISTLNNRGYNLGKAVDFVMCKNGC
jgi:hypothetical protein